MWKPNGYAFFLCSWTCSFWLQWLKYIIYWRKGRQRTRWLDGITNSKDMSLNKRWKMVKVREDWHAVVNTVTNSRTQLSDWTVHFLQWYTTYFCVSIPPDLKVVKPKPWRCCDLLFTFSLIWSFIMDDFDHLSVLCLEKNILFVCFFKTLDKMTTITTSLLKSWLLTCMLFKFFHLSLVAVV